MGCGTGGLVRALAPLVRTAQGIDRSPQIVKVARETTRDLTNVVLQTRDLMDVRPVPAYDAVTAIAVVHHLPLARSAPVAPVANSLKEIRSAVARELPGARKRRGLFWRYCLKYTKPG